jgi:excisionase family DNA binding protein
MHSTENPETRQPNFTREDLLTPAEVAAILRLRRSTVLDYMRRGVIPAFKIGRSWYSLRSRLDEHLAAAADHLPA